MTAAVNLNGDHLVAQQYLDAGPALVWQALTTPTHLAKFWGGDHAHIPPDSVKVDLRAGGMFELAAEGAEGDRKLLRFRYQIIDEPRRLVFTEPLTGIRTEIRLDVTGDGTTVTVHQRRLPPALQTEQARTGLAGIFEHLAVLVRELRGTRAGE